MTRPAKVCADPNCAAILTDGHARCAAHRRELDAQRPSAVERGYATARWRRTRTTFLAEHPWCECGCGQPATDVHHRDGLGPLGPRGHDPSNLAALAHDCHSRVTRSEQRPGTPTQEPGR